MAVISTEEKLQERIKELSCLYNISTALRQNLPPTETLEMVCSILRAAYRYPEYVIVAVKIDHLEISTAEIPTRSLSQICPLEIFGEIRGQIGVYYNQSVDRNFSFLDDEQRLLQKVASEISIYHEQHLREQEISVLKRSAERADRLAILGEITAGIAHELNTPLGNILGFAELIASRTTDNQTQLDAAKVIKAAIYSREIVKKLMFFSCEMPQHMQLIKVVPVVEQALTLLEPNFRKAQVEFTLTVLDREVQAQLDPIQLTQVLFNILVNAIYVSPPETRVAISIESDDNSIFIEIKDQGPGIEPSIKHQIFEPFFTTKPFGEGNGLGLSVVHGIIKSHHGKISTFDNTPKGTVFKIELPLKHSQ
ncbi:MAG: HAMP domain-containing histidine kinase [Flavobacterium sp.]|nr:HAMP domain-containing histidine kinase [Flavobacterium sp.]